MNAGTLTSKQLVKAELYRIALTNADGSGDPGDPQHQPRSDRGSRGESDAHAGQARNRPLGRWRDPGGRRRLDRTSRACRRALARSRCENDMPAADATIVAKLKAAGAIILGDTNTTELGGVFEGPNMPQGYSSLGGQVLLASDTNKNVGRLLGRLGGCRGRRSRAAGDRHGDLDRSGPADRAGGQRRRRGAEADGRAGQPHGHPAGRQVPGLARARSARRSATSRPRWACSPAPTRATRPRRASRRCRTTRRPVADGAERQENRRGREHDRAHTRRASPSSAALGATTDVVTPGTGTTAPSIIPYEFHKDLERLPGDRSDSQSSKVPSRCSRSSNTTTPTRSRA